MVIESHYRKVLQEDTWVVLSGLEDARTYERYITAVYWSMSTLCTVRQPSMLMGSLGAPAAMPAAPCCANDTFWFVLQRHRDQLGV